MRIGLNILAVTLPLLPAIGGCATYPQAGSPHQAYSNAPGLELPPQPDRLKTAAGDTEKDSGLGQGALIADVLPDPESPSTATRSTPFNGRTPTTRDHSVTAIDSSDTQTAVIVPASHADEMPDERSSVTDSALPSPESMSAAEPFAGAEQAPVLDDVISSVYASYPKLQAAVFQRNVAMGEQVMMQGAFDTKLKASSENGPAGFYQTYRQSVGVVQPVFSGGEVFAGYRVGRGDFEPWYQERQTNNGGEFKAGVEVPLWRDRNIDERRTELWNSIRRRQAVEPDIQAQLIGFVQEGSYAYWDWVAAGEYHQIAVRLVNLAESRTERIEAQVKAGLLDPPELTDNLRLVSIRKAKAADTRRKLDQKAAKLSLYLRDATGNPRVPARDMLPGFPPLTNITAEERNNGLVQALSMRPELQYIDLQRQQVDTEYAQARNMLQPELDAVLAGKQDVGLPTSKKRDKSEFELEAGLFFNVPVQRRKARGKLIALEGKVAQLNAKRRLTSDKIVVDVNMAFTALESADEQVQLTRQAVAQAEELADRERDRLDAGASDMLKVTLREEYAAESAEKLVAARQLFFEAAADYRAAIATDSLESITVSVP